MTAVVRELSSAKTDEEEWRLRCDMAAVFRAGARLGWNEQIGNHNRAACCSASSPRAR